MTSATFFIISVMSFMRLTIARALLTPFCRLPHAPRRPLPRCTRRARRRALHAGRVERRAPAALVVLRQLEVEALAVHPHGDVADAGPGVQPGAQRPELSGRKCLLGWDRVVARQRNTRSSPLRILHAEESATNDNHLNSAWITRWNLRPSSELACVASADIQQTRLWRTPYHCPSTWRLTLVCAQPFEPHQLAHLSARLSHLGYFGNGATSIRLG